jgi:hypothetical protein
MTGQVRQTVGRSYVGLRRRIYVGVVWEYWDLRESATRDVEPTGRKQCLLTDPRVILGRQMDVNKRVKIPRNRNDDWNNGARQAIATLYAPVVKRVKLARFRPKSGRVCRSSP